MWQRAEYFIVCLICKCCPLRKLRQETYQHNYYYSCKTTWVSIRPPSFWLFSPNTSSKTCNIFFKWERGRKSWNVKECLLGMKLTCSDKIKTSLNPTFIQPAALFNTKTAPSWSFALPCILSEEAGHQKNPRHYFVCSTHDFMHSLSYPLILSTLDILPINSLPLT